VHSREDIEREVERLGAIQPWWQDIELPHGARTIGRPPDQQAQNHNVPKWRRIAPLLALQGRRVIDVGCNEGYFSIEARRAGADSVLAIDRNPYRVEKARFVVRTVGVDGVDVREADALALGPEVGHFDLALCLGLLHRVSDPFRLVAAVAHVADSMVFEWLADPSVEPVAAFRVYGHKAEDPDNSGFWTPTRTCLEAMLWRCGVGWAADVEPAGKRAVVVATRDRASGVVRPARWESLDSRFRRD
jgi:tRNA (mo5U34)-methyltransferase